MGAWRVCATVAALLALALPAAAETYLLKETPQKDDCFQFEVDMKLEGKMDVIRETKPVSFQLSATARHVFAQRLLELDAKGIPQKAACVYQSAQAIIKAGPSESARKLSDDHNLLVIERVKDQNEVYCPKGPLTREEMELTSETFDTLALTGLLPGKEVALKDSWNVPVQTVQALCHFEGVTNHAFTCTLEEVKGDVATVKVAGKAEGIDLGAKVEITLEATSYRFDLKAQRIISIDWSQKDVRAEGPANPGSVTNTTYRVQRKQIDEPEALNNFALVSVPQGGVTDELLLLYCRDPKGRYHLHYDRDWQVVTQTDERTVLRLLERGDFVAQATVTPWRRARPGDHLTADQFKGEVASTPGWKQDQILQEGIMESPGRWVYRVSASGELRDRKVVQNFYLIAMPTGEQVVIAVTTEQGQAQKLGDRDLGLVSNLEIPAK